MAFINNKRAWQLLDASVFWVHTLEGVGVMTDRQQWLLLQLDANDIRVKTRQVHACKK